ncbi:MAG: hypothetical protein DYH13_08995 [Alphaproteobacteria bacterium PRO2]|nr:hypothetical protein [Alphaproteobacteria bacterium PRO2]
MSNLYDYINEITDLGSFLNKEEAMRNNIKAWFQRRLTIIESQYKEGEEKFWSWMFEMSKANYFNNLAAPAPVPA